MRAAIILGPGNVSKVAEKFRRIGNAEWTSGATASSGDADVVVIFGGDGTVHSYLPQLVSLGLPVLVVPCGSRNDFARALKLRSVHDSLGAWRLFLRRGNNVRTIDLGVIHDISPASANPGAAPFDFAQGSSAPHYFCCVAGAGLDAQINRRANALPKWIRSHGGYALSAPREFLPLAPFPMKISLEGENAGPAQP